MHTNDPHIIYSPLQRRFTQGGHTIEILIYRSPGTKWYLEVVNSVGTSTLWDDPFKTDQEALDEILSVIEKDGIGEFVEHDPEDPVH